MIIYKSAQVIRRQRNTLSFSHQQLVLVMFHDGKPISRKKQEHEQKNEKMPSTALDVYVAVYDSTLRLTGDMIVAEKAAVYAALDADKMLKENLELYASLGDAEVDVACEAAFDATKKATHDSRVAYEAQRHAKLFVLKRQKLKAMKRKDEWNKLKLMARDAEEKRMARDAEEKRMKLDSVEKNAGAH